jgi:phosphoenolpyruvate phosphomutase|tara:strand:+ start:539 stop:1339 length:801 start_codon:yes stop_codon:yes gene_type:complete
MSDIKGIILAAGEGKRLQHLTKDCPKCMVKLFGKSLLEHQIDAFRKCGINDITVIKGHKGEMINFSGIKYYENKDYKSTNMVETLFCALHELNGPTIISYGDIIFEKKVLEKLILSKSEISVVIDQNWKEYWSIRMSEIKEDVESLKLNSAGDIVDIGQKVKDVEEIGGQYIGLMKFGQNGIQNLKEFYFLCKEKSSGGKNPLNQKLPFKKSYMTDLLQGLIHAGYKLTSIPINGGWLELDTINDYDLYNNLKKESGIRKLISLEK